MKSSLKYYHHLFYFLIYNVSLLNFFSTDLCVQKQIQSRNSCFFSGTVFCHVYSFVKIKYCRFSEPAYGSCENSDKYKSYAFDTGVGRNVITEKAYGRIGDLISDISVSSDKLFKRFYLRKGNPAKMSHLSAKHTGGCRKLQALPEDDRLAPGT